MELEREASNAGASRPASAWSAHFLVLQDPSVDLPIQGLPVSSVSLSL